MKLSIAALATAFALPATAQVPPATAGTPRPVAQASVPAKAGAKTEARTMRGDCATPRARKANRNASKG